jgi:hypothetical protein
MSCRSQRLWPVSRAVGNKFCDRDVEYLVGADAPRVRTIGVEPKDTPYQPI